MHQQNILLQLQVKSAPLPIKILQHMDQSLEVLLDAYRSKPPEIVFEWKDSETDAEGWIVINSLRGGAAGGGTRMRKGLTKDEVVSLAKVMEIKFSVAGPNIGGAKSGINFDPTDSRKYEVLTRWYKVALPILKHYYGTGGDLNVDEMKDVIPITEDLGLWHPQEGIVRGHLKPDDGRLINAIGQLRYGCAKTVEDKQYAPDPEGNHKYAVADLITGFGVSEAVSHYYSLFKQSDLRGKTVIVQGWGNVASAAGLYLSRKGAKIVGIIDRAGGYIDPQGIKDIEDLFLSKEQNKLTGSHLLSFEEANERIWDLGAQIFIPGAASKIVTFNHVSRLIDNGLEVMACGANVPFTDDGVFFGQTAKFADERIALIPDFIANCGMARVFAYLMQQDITVTDKAIFGDVSDIIKNALSIVKKNGSEGKKISHHSLHLSLQNLLNLNKP
jgi:glutamate dehydrogenase/leucine dehydrogenase